MKPDPPSTSNVVVETSQVSSNDLPGSDPPALDPPTLDPPTSILPSPLDLLTALDQAFDPTGVAKDKMELDQIQQEEEKDPTVVEENEEIFGNEIVDAPLCLSEIAKKKKKKMSKRMSGENKVILKFKGGVIDPLENLKSAANMRRAAALDLKMQKKRNEPMKQRNEQMNHDPESDVSGWLFDQTEAFFEEIFHDAHDGNYCGDVESAHSSSDEKDDGDDNFVYTQIQVNIESLIRVRNRMFLMTTKKKSRKKMTILCS